MLNNKINDTDAFRLLTLTVTFYLDWVCGNVDQWKHGCTTQRDVTQLQQERIRYRQTRRNFIRNNTARTCTILHVHVYDISVE